MNFLNSSFNLLSFKGGNDDKVRYEYDRGYIEISKNEEGLPTLRSRLFKITSDNDNYYDARYEYYHPSFQSGEKFEFSKKKDGSFRVVSNSCYFRQKEMADALRDAKELKEEMEKCEDERIKNNPLKEKLDELIGHFETEIEKIKPLYGSQDLKFFVSSPENPDTEDESKMIETKNGQIVQHKGRLYYKEDDNSGLEERKIVSVYKSGRGPIVKCVNSSETGTLETRYVYNKEGKLIVKEEFNKDMSSVKAEIFTDKGEHGILTSDEKDGTYVLEVKHAILTSDEKDEKGAPKETLKFRITGKMDKNKPQRGLKWESTWEWYQDGDESKNPIVMRQKPKHDADGVFRGLDMECDLGKDLLPHVDNLIGDVKDLAKLCDNYSGYSTFSTNKFKTYHFIDNMKDSLYAYRYKFS